MKEARTFQEHDGNLHAVALVQDDKGITSSFVEDEVLVRNDPVEVSALMAKYHARVVRQITVNMISAAGKPLPPVPTTPMTVLQIDATSSPLHLEIEAPAIKATGTHAFSFAKSANLAAIVAHERAAGHSVNLNFLGHGMDFPTSSKEQADQAGVSDAYQWPEFDHSAWQYVLDAGSKTHPLVAIIDGGFWLNSQGIPCGFSNDPLCETPVSAAPVGADGKTTCEGTPVSAVGKSDLPRGFLQGDATGGPGPAGGTNPASCTGGSRCPWHGNASAGVAIGEVDNDTGAAGMGGLVAKPMLIKTDMSFRRLMLPLTRQSAKVLRSFPLAAVVVAIGGASSGTAGPFSSVLSLPSGPRLARLQVAS